MRHQWEEALACATQCSRCEARLGQHDKRILSVYDHQPICLACKTREERREDYAEVAKTAIGSCMAETELQYSDPNGFCYHHFYPYDCHRE
ncbi:MAG: hypothetical protein P8010_25195 [Desulfosarcinaceae bacterium]|jgi:hypothetical protein